MDQEGRLYSPSSGNGESQELCVGADLRLHRCQDEGEIWVFTQVSLKLIDSQSRMT